MSDLLDFCRNLRDSRPVRKQVALNEVRVGSTVMVRGAFGMDAPVRATVTEVERVIKNGQPGICYNTANDANHWAYLNQVDEVIKY
jgi:hypothetical protein